MVDKFFRITTIILFSLLIIFLPGPIAGSSGIDLDLVEPRELVTPPGEFLTFSYRVLNTTDKKITLQGQVQLPQDLAPLTPAPRFTLKPGQSTINLLSFNIPRDMPSGDYRIKYLLRGEQGEVRAEKEVILEVLPRIGLEVKPGVLPPRVIAGETYELTFSIRNVSNTELQVSSVINDSHDFELQLEQDRYVLAPGATSIIVVGVATDPDLRERTVHRLTLEVEAETEDQEMITETVRSRVNLLPRVSGIDDPYHRLPVSLAADFSYRGDLGVQFKLEAKGPITPDEEQFADLLIRPPALGITGDDFSRTSPEYRYSHWNDLWRLDLGDHRFSLSPLTEQRFPGRGLAFNIEEESYAIGAYYRWDRDWQDSGWAFHVDYYPADNWGLKLGFLDLDGGLDRDRLITLGSEFRLLGGVNFDLEYARSFGAEGEQAYRVDVDGSYEGLRYGLGYLRSDPDFPGRISDRESYNLKLGYSFLPEFSVQGAYDHRRVNLDFDPGQEALQRDRVEVKGRLRLDSYSFDLIYNRQWVQDQSLNPATDGISQAWEGIIRHTFSDFNFRLSYKRTWWEDLLLSQAGAYDNFRFWLDYQPGDWHRYRTDYRLRLKEGQIRHWGTLSARFDIQEDIRLDLDYTREQEISNGDNEEQENSSKDRFTASLALALPEQEAEISFRGSYIRREDKAGELAFGIEYSQKVSFGLPLGRRPVGRLSGQIFDDLDPQSAGREGIIIKVDGLTAVSDEEGYFKFPDLEPGDYYLQVDRASLEPGEVIDKDLPLSFNIEAQEEKVIDLPVVEGASISGQALVYSPERIKNNNLNNNNLQGESNGNNSIILNQGLELEPDYGLSRLLLILRSGENNDLRIEHTDNEGNFRFTALRPGTYELLINSNGQLPRQHEIKEERIIFQLAVGENQEVEIKIVPLERELEFIDEGTVLKPPDEEDSAQQN